MRFGGILKATKDLQQQLREAKEQLRIGELKILDLEALVRSSEDVKTAKIVHLEDTCQRSHKELQDVEEMCRVLTSETKKLQAELAASQLQLESSCKELADWKEKAQNLDTKVLNVSLQKMAFHKESNLSVADQLKIAEGQVEQLEKESSRLTDQLREVIGMNTRWQRYNEQRETHVLKLTKTNQHQQSKITVLEQQKRDLEQTINGLNVMLQKLKEEQRKNTDAAILALEHQVSRREDRISEMAEELSALKMYLQSNEDATETRQRPEDRERIQILEQQLKAYKDDFQQERRDRERVQSNNEVLKHRLQDATRKIAGFEQQNARVTPNFTTNIAGYQPQRRLIARGISRPSYASDEEAYRVSDLEIDAHDETDGPSSSTEPLQCPRCAQEFTVENHSIFMRHVGVCLDQ
ncbi:TNFAIP3-interacting protein 2-like isoform X2 [Patiria miniata]|uniref:Uncharacterized protein n=1 Tax=Patiria miniata TaxID=46514 RepID=A0A913Z5I9_PATMI|nr:TNFAIP3-interacting protein 2-like isoform X2 [Patiria miniata]